MFSADYRAAVAAEAAGNVDAAAQRYALAGELQGAVRMHIARAARATTRRDEVAALRDALRWAGDDPALRAQASRPLGRALLESAVAEGVATQRDRDRVREAAELLVAGGDFSAAGDAYESIADLAAAAQAYSSGGLIDRLEAILAKESAQTERDRDEGESFKNYETYMRIGRRDDARAELMRAIAAGDRAGSYRRLLDQLDSALITGGRIELKRRNSPSVFACVASKITIGRDALCDLPLRAGCVSRQHAVIDRTDTEFLLRDGGSRNGTLLEGLPLFGAVPLVGSGRFGLGHECSVQFDLMDGILVLSAVDGLDRGVSLIAGAPEGILELRRVGLPLEMTFRDGRPLLGRGAALKVTVNGEPLGDLRVQLIRGDQIVADDDEVAIG
jgi:tetratricopeptide (TPR) repeat protein